MSQQQQGQSEVPRGRGQFRGRRRFGAPRNYGSPSRIQAAEKETQRVEAILKDNEERAKKAVPSPKVAEYVEAGKQLVSKFFKGYQQEERGNIKIEIDDHIPERISEVYSNRILQQAEEDFVNIADRNRRNRLSNERYERFVGGVHLGLAVKLYNSASDLEKSSLFNINVLSAAKVTLPEKAGIILNQLGKTDLPNDNRIRVINQNFACKRFLFKSLCQYYRVADLTPSLTLRNGRQAQHLYDNVFGFRFPKMIDDSARSVQVLKTLGREYFEEVSKASIAVQVNSTTRAQAPAPAANVQFEISLPPFNFDADDLQAEVTNYLNNPLFAVGPARHFDYADNNLVTNVVCSLVFQIAQIGWIRNSNRTMAVIDNQFANTFIANATFLQVMNQVGIWNCNDFLPDNDLNDQIATLLYKWNTVDVSTYRKILNLKEIHFSEFGTDAQVISVDDNAIDQDSRIGRVRSYCIKRKPISKSQLKVSETGGLFGIMSKFSRSVKFISDFSLMHDSNNRNLLREFLKSDFSK